MPAVGMSVAEEAERLNSEAEILNRMAEERRIRWMLGGESAEELQEQYNTSSQLRKLLLRHKFTRKGLETHECSTASKLVAVEKVVDEKCTRCGDRDVSVVGDTKLCRAHLHHEFIQK